MLLNEESNEFVQFEKLFTMYQFESLDIFGLKDPINIERFSVGLQKCSNSKENGKKNQICERPKISRLSLLK